MRRGASSSSRLDKILIFDDILLQGFHIEETILHCRGSDHWMVLLIVEMLGNPKNIPLKLEAFWINHPFFMENIKKWLKDPLPIWGTKMFKIKVRLLYMKTQLKHSNKT